MGILGQLSQMAKAGRVDQFDHLLHDEMNHPSQQTYSDVLTNSRQHLSRGDRAGTSRDRRHDDEIHYSSF